MARKTKRGRGRLKRSTARGPTISIQVPKDVVDEVMAACKRAEEVAARSVVVEQLIRQSLKDQLARSPFGKKKR